jgi:methionyl-tRNA formyltransferase
MNVAFAGTSQFARVALESLCGAGFRVGLVLTQPDRPAGRGLKLHASPVKEFALERSLQLTQPHGLRLDGKYSQDATAARQLLQSVQPDVIVVAAYGLILPQWALDLARLGCINIHGSLLPRWRGAAPIHRAIEAGDAQTGVTIMQMDAGLDTGAMLLAQSLPIAPDDTTATLHDKLASLGGGLIVQALELAQCSCLVPRAQPETGVTYASKVDKGEAAIDWREPAAAIERRIRAFDPFPGASAQISGDIIKCWRAELVQGSGSAGEVLSVDEGGITVACGQGALKLTELQRAGGKRLAAAPFLHGWTLGVGMVFDPVER